MRSSSGRAIITYRCLGLEMRFGTRVREPSVARNFDIGLQVQIADTRVTCTICCAVTYSRAYRGHVYCEAIVQTSWLRSRHCFQHDCYQEYPMGIESHLPVRPPATWTSWDSSLTSCAIFPFVLQRAIVRRCVEDAFVTSQTFAS